MKIEPLPNEDRVLRVVKCFYVGDIYHASSEVNHRNISGEKKKKLAEEIMRSLTIRKYYNNVLKSNKEKIKHGNFSSVPTPTVLKRLFYKK